jgi:uncharacterized membrane protein
MPAKNSDKTLLKGIASDIKDIKTRLSRIEGNVKEELAIERRIASEEVEELDELARLEALEKEILEDVSPHPLAQITYRDFTKGIIGSFFGIVGHFAFFYGGRIALEIDMVRAHLLFVTSFLILVVFMYFSGFRKIKRDVKHHYMAWRVLIIYLTAHAVIAFVLTLFGRIELAMSFSEIYKNIAAVSILAVMGAATADLIGGE